MSRQIFYYSRQIFYYSRQIFYYSRQIFYCSWHFIYLFIYSCIYLHIYFFIVYFIFFTPNLYHYHTSFPFHIFLLAILVFRAFKAIIVHLFRSYFRHSSSPSHPRLFHECLFKKFFLIFYSI